jgi:hypothetical protein
VSSGSTDLLDGGEGDHEVRRLVEPLRRGGELEDVAGGRADEVLVEVLGDPALADLVGPALGVEPGQFLVVAGDGEVEREEVAVLHGTVGVDERGTALQLGLVASARSSSVTVSAGQFDAQTSVASHRDRGSHLAGRVELDGPGLGAVGDLDFGRGDQVDLVLAHRLGEVLRHRIAQGLFTRRTDTDLRLEHLPWSLARSEPGKRDLLGDELERPIDVVFELRLVDFDVQLDFVALEGLHRTLHRRASVPAALPQRSGQPGDDLPVGTPEPPTPRAESRVGPSNGQNGGRWSSGSRTPSPRRTPISSICG